MPAKVLGFKNQCALYWWQVMKQYLRKNWKLILNVVTVLVLGLVVYFLREEIGQALRDLGRVNAVALLLIIPLQLQNVAAQAHLYQDFLKILGSKQDFRLMFKVGLEMNFVNNVFPSGGVSGFSYFAARLKPLGVSTAQSTLTQMMRFMLTFVSFVVLLFIGLFLLALGGSASNMTILITCSLAFLTVFLVLVGVYIVSSKSRIRTFTRTATKVVNRILHVVRPQHPETIELKRVELVFDEMHENYLLLKQKFPDLKKPLFYATLANLTEIATIYTVYIAYGQFVNPGAVIIAYALANVAGLVAVLPGGIGVYEGLMTLVLVSAGIPAGLAISVTVMYRVLNMALKLPPGYYYYRQALSELGNGAPPRAKRASHA